MWVSSVRDVLFGHKGNGLGIYLRMSGVVALGSLLVQVTHTESGPGPASAVGGQGHWTLGRTEGNPFKEWSGNRGAPCVHMLVPPACMTRDGWACLEGCTRDRTCAKDTWLVVNITAAILNNSNCDISAADHPIPIYSVFGSRTGFSGSADRIALFPVSLKSIGMREKQCARSN